MIMKKWQIGKKHRLCVSVNETISIYINTNILFMIKNLLRQRVFFNNSV